MAEPGVVHWTAYVTAFALPLIAGVGTWIALQQARTASRQAATAEKKLKFDLFERRLDLYNRLHLCTKIVLEEGKLGDDEKAALIEGHKHALWLFSPAVANHIKRNLYPAADAYSEARARGGLDHVADENKEEVMLETRRKLRAERGALTDLVSPFLSLGH